VFGGLSGRQDAGIAQRAIIDFVDDLLTFRNDSEDRIAGLAARLLADSGEYLLQPFDMALGFVAVGGEGLLQFFIGALLGELRQGLEKLFLGKINVLKKAVKEFVHGLHVHAPIATGSEMPISTRRMDLFLRQSMLLH
jgi:hypothetical protein